MHLKCVVHSCQQIIIWLVLAGCSVLIKKKVPRSAVSESKPNKERFSIHKLLYWSGFMWDVWRVE